MQAGDSFDMNRCNTSFHKELEIPQAEEVRHII
jgi:hypothetical protein